MAQANMRIEGMSCKQCVMRVKKAFGLMPGVCGADVRLGSATVTFDDMRVRKSDLERAVEKAGYRVRRGTACP